MKTKKIFIVISLILCLLFLLVDIPVNGFIFSHAAEEETLKVEVFGRNDEKLIVTPGSYSGSTAYVYKWEEAGKIVFKVDMTNTNPNPKYDSNEEKYYEAKISFEFLKGYSDSSVDFAQADTIYLEDVYTATARGEGSYLNFDSSFHYEYNLDRGITKTDTNGHVSTIQGWGIYRFKLIVNDVQIYSDFYIFEPSTVYVKPEIRFVERESNVTLRNSYVFSITNNSQFQYVDRNALTWYAKGTTENGKKICLMESDLNLPLFFDCEEALFKSYERNGQEFTFEDNGKYGVWEIWCEYSPHGAKTRQSESITIRTKKPFDALFVLWIALGLVAASIIGTIVICAVKIKREKVY